YFALAPAEYVLSWPGVLQEVLWQRGDSESECAEANMPFRHLHRASSKSFSAPQKKNTHLFLRHYMALAVAA
ncbi:MAG TPA: hypothetical protein VHD63_04010, partial [Ktedonobacteraceae bacterium]|nr:hypothetical protein [Ktedonobacteraceae bacterium]